MNSNKKEKNNPSQSEGHSQQRVIRCPRCGKDSIYSPENPYRPFCSDRCKLIDLGDWASEKFAIPANQNDLDTQEIRDESDEETSSDSLSRKNHDSDFH